jgi:hypothetical protein
MISQEQLRREPGFWAALKMGAGTMIGASPEWRIGNMLFASVPNIGADCARSSALMVRHCLPER